MTYVLETKNGRETQSREVVLDNSVEYAAIQIENWMTKFSPFCPTTYGFKLTVDFLNTMEVNEIAIFSESGETLRVTRISDGHNP